MRGGNAGKDASGVQPPLPQESSDLPQPKNRRQRPDLDDNDDLNRVNNDGEQTLGQDKQL